MPTSTITQEINASAGSVGASYRFTLGPSEPALRVNHGPSRTATLTNLGPGIIRQATVANDGTFGTFSDVASGSTQTVTTADRVFVLSAPDITNAVSVVIS